MSKEFIAPLEPKTSQEAEAFEEKFLTHKEAQSSERRSEVLSPLTSEQKEMLKKIKRIQLEWPIVGDEMDHTYPKIEVSVEISGERINLDLTGPGGSFSDRAYLLEDLDEKRGFSGNIRKIDSEEYTVLSGQESKDLFIFYVPLVGILKDKKLSRQAEPIKNGEVSDLIDKLQGK